MKNTFSDEKETRKKLADFILNADRLSMSEKCAQFEEEFSKFQKRKYSVLFNSGGSANLALIQVLLNLGILKKGDNVGFSALTWSTNVMPIIQLGLNPVPIDIELERLNVTSQTLLNAIRQNNLHAFFATNILGMTGDLQKIKEVCSEKDIIFIEDNCESLGTELTTGMAGNFGLAASFSFYVAHHLSTIEGGMICTDDENLADMLKVIRANGWDRNLDAEKQKILRNANNIQDSFYANFSFYDLAYNLRPTEITGFLGLTQLEHLEKNIALRENNFIKFQNFISNSDHLISFNIEDYKTISSYCFPVICKSIDIRSKLINQCHVAGIEVRPIISGNMLDQPFYKKYVQNSVELPNTEFVHNCGFYCGNFPELTEDELGLILDSLEIEE